MKKLILFSALLAVIGFQSCKEADTPTPADPELVGVWNFDSMNIDNGLVTVDGTPFIQFSTNTSNEVGTVDFNANSNVTMNIGYSNTTTLTMFGSTTTDTENVPQQSHTQAYIYDEVANTVTMDQDTIPVTYNIIELTDSRLVLKAELSETETENGITTMSSLTQTWFMSK